MRIKQHKSKHNPPVVLEAGCGMNFADHVRHTFSVYFSFFEICSPKSQDSPSWQFRWDLCRSDVVPDLLVFVQQLWPIVLAEWTASLYYCTLPILLH